MTCLLELDAVQCTRGDRPLFAPVSARVEPGRLLRVDGPNGSGKTTLLRTVCGLSAASAGQVRWRGRAVGHARERFNAELFYQGHAPALKDELSATENLRAACRFAGHDCSAQDAAAALAQAGLRGREHLPARALSQGQRKRAVLARLALAGETPLWVLDEPFAALDDTAAGWLAGLVGRHLARGGVVVLTSHEVRAWDGLGTPVTVGLVPARQAALAE